MILFYQRKTSHLVRKKAVSNDDDEAPGVMK